MVHIPGISAELLSEIKDRAIEKTVPENTVILKEGQYIKVIPLVLEGLLKVYTQYQEKELLLYYIQPNESCVMSFSSGLKNEPSKIYAMTEEETRMLLLPVDDVMRWTKNFPDFNSLFFSQFNLRYSDLLETINQLLFDKMDKRLLDYLQQKVKMTQKNPLKISHRQIAAELGTAREVISRVMKKLETDGRVRQIGNSVEVI
ncbi:MAG: Crp/Fnr family transcriptional regulator [Cytophagaceae bacterium]|nr:Crp/Fnr family transcriptional regulator [Cytophagaceae bacterium]MBL0300885.1 Crp/Fnr family transcriptional regulator [Cytophagaceae bacterium]MBL0323698.1 Crp/Fnr family transcriptional regulator [Cytophagaceae bacterium]